MTKRPEHTATNNERARVCEKNVRIHNSSNPKEISENWLYAIWSRCYWQNKRTHTHKPFLLTLSLFSLYISMFFCRLHFYPFVWCVFSCTLNLLNRTQARKLCAKFRKSSKSSFVTKFPCARNHRLKKRCGHKMETLLHDPNEVTAAAAAEAKATASAKATPTIEQPSPNHRRKFPSWYTGWRVQRNAHTFNCNSVQNDTNNKTHTRKEKTPNQIV